MLRRARRSPLLAQTPVNAVPVADQSEDEKNGRDEKKAGRLGRVGDMAVMFVAGIVLVRGGEHGAIVARRKLLDEAARRNR